MGATFSRLKDWTTEILTHADLNAEIDNILDNLGPVGIDDYSANLAQMQTITSPVNVLGNAVLPTSLAGEIENIRYQIKSIIGNGVDWWYEQPSATLSGLAEIVFANSVPSTRLESIDSDSYVNLLVPEGTANSVTLKGASNTIVFYVEDVRYELDTDVTFTGLTVAPSSQNTAVFTETAETATHNSTLLGEHGSTILIGTVGTNISSSTAQAGFKVVRGGTTEYFTAQYLNDTTDGAMLEKARRGGFFNSLNAAIPRTTINTSDTITLMKLAWMFLKSDLTLTVTYNPPTYSYTTPTAPSVGDYWFDFNTTTWKVYSALGFNESGAVYVGQAMSDATNTVAARSVEPYKIYQSANEVELEAVGTAATSFTIKSLYPRVSVYGNQHNFGTRNQAWNAATLESGTAFANNTMYYVYITEAGQPKLSTIAPHNRVGDMAGFYHPSHSWRCLGYGSTGGSGTITQSSIINFSLTNDKSFFSNDTAQIGMSSTVATANIPPGWRNKVTTAVSRGLYHELRDSRNALAMASIGGTGDGSTTFNILPGFASSNYQTFTPAGNIGGGTNYTASGRFWRSDGGHVEGRMYLAFTGDPGVGSGAFRFNLPTGFTADGSFYNYTASALNDSVSQVGDGFFWDNSVSSKYLLKANLYGTTQITLQIVQLINTDKIYTFSSLSNSGVIATIANGDILEFYFKVKVTDASWSTQTLTPTEIIKALR